jgi:hypothetical protein
MAEYTERQLTNPSEPPAPGPWVFIKGRWYLVATDTSDGVPDSLEHLHDDEA